MLMMRAGLQPSDVKFDDIWPRLRSVTLRLLTNRVLASAAVPVSTSTSAVNRAAKPAGQEPEPAPDAADTNAKKNQVPPEEYREMIRLVYKLCVAKPTPFGQELYEHLRDLLQEHMSKLLLSLQEIDARQDASLLLDHYLWEWKRFNVGLGYVSNLFDYLGRYWIKKHQASGIIQTYPSDEVHDIRKLGMYSWMDHVFTPFKESLVRALLTEIAGARQGDSSNLEKVKGVLNCYVSLTQGRGRTLQVYIEGFEVPYLAASVSYYHTKAGAYIEHHSMTEYAQKALVWLDEEARQAERYLHVRTMPLLMAALDKELITNQKTRLDEEAGRMLSEGRMPALRNVYLLLKRISSPGAVVSLVYERTRKSGEQAVKAFEESFRREQAEGKSQKKRAERNKAYVEGMVSTLLSEYSVAKDLTDSAFDSDPDFVVARDSALRVVVNRNRKNPEYLAYYCDHVLRKGGRPMADSEIQTTLDNVMRLFTFLDDKDLFLGHYSVKLARRLIQDTSSSTDAEQSFIAALKLSNGYEYTSKLQRMFTDMTGSNVNEKFSSYQDRNGSDLGVDFNVRVLTQGSWPLALSMSEIKLPSELAKCLATFQSFYSEAHNGRVLHWQHQLATGTVKAKFTAKKYEFILSTHQIVLLLVFNTSNEYTVSELLTVTGLVPEELTRALASFVDLGVLKVSGEGIDIKATGKWSQLPGATVVELNSGFSNKRTRIKLATVVQLETPQETQEVHERVEEDRKNLINACIVRVMKARQTLSHHDLIQEIIQQMRVRFQPHIPMIKRQIEALIEREYLRRDASQDSGPDTYVYVA